MWTSRARCEFLLTCCAATIATLTSFAACAAIPPRLTERNDVRLEPFDRPSWGVTPGALARPDPRLPLNVPDEPPNERSPAPIPLPPAAIAGPIVLTSLIAGAIMKKRRPARRRLR
jgi:hypothetical protein